MSSLNLDDVELNKCAIIERCLSRVETVYANDPINLTADLTHQDSIILNLQRACEAAIDLAMHRVRIGGLGIPQDSRDAFELLCRSGSIDTRLATALKAMVGFRNVAVHDYQELNLEIVRAIIETRLADLRTFARVVSRS